MQKREILDNPIAAADPTVITQNAVPETVLDFREIGDHLYDGVYISDGSGKTLYVNKSYERITGLQASELVGRRVQDLVAAGVYANAVTPEVLRQRKQVNSVGQSLRNGAKLLVTGVPVFDRKGEVKLVAVIQRESPISWKCRSSSRPRRKRCAPSRRWRAARNVRSSICANR